MPQFDETREAMNALAKVMTELFPGLGFALLIFEFHKPGMSNYISNAERSTMVTVLREAADRLAGAQDIPPDQKN
jgi:hypothetical protein